MTGKIITTAKDKYELFQAYCNEIVLSYDYLHASYSKNGMEYRKQGLKDNDLFIEDCSFVLSENGNPYFAFFGFLRYEDRNKIKKTISTGDVPAYSIEKSHISSSKKKVICEAILSLMQKHECTLTYEDRMFRNGLSSLGNHLITIPEFSCKNRYHRQIDLEKGINELRANLRSRYKTLINKGMDSVTMPVTWPYYGANSSPVQLFSVLLLRV